MLHHGQPKNVFISGGSGFLGRHLAKQISKVHNVRLTFSSHRINLPKCESIRMNLMNEFSVREAMKGFKPDVVIHTAAIADAAKCEDAPEIATSVNVSGAEKLMKSIPNKDALFVYISTDLVFDGDRGNYAEDDEPNPMSHYAKTKHRGERAVRKNWKNHIILRTALMYGPELTKGNGSFLQWMDNAFQTQDEIALFGDEFRTPVYVKDVAKAAMILVERKVRHHILHIGGPERLTRVEFGKKLAEIRGYDATKIKETSLADLNTGYSRPKDVSLNSSRIQEAMKLKLTSVEDALKDMLTQ